MKAYWDDDVTILSAENIEFQVETAGLGSRFAAVTIDMTIQLLAFTVMSLVAYYIMGGISPADWTQYVLGFAKATFGIAAFFLFYAYFFIFEWLWAGQTPGKRWLGLRVIHATGMPATWWPIFVRNLLRIADFLPFMYGAGSLIAVLNIHNQRIGDQVAGTIVARERRGGEKRPLMTISEAVEAFLNPQEVPRPQAQSDTPIAPVETAPEVDIDPESAAIRVKLSQEDYELVRDFLARREQLPIAARERLAESLANRLGAKLGRPLPLEHEREYLLEEVARAFGKK
jgi:uncharacterized RDD family membrane protein YckC